MAAVIQLVGSCKSCRAGTDDGDLFSGTLKRDARLDFTGSERFLDNIEFIVADRNRGVILPAETGALARGGAYASGELWEIICLQEPGERMGLIIVINHLVPFRNQIVERTAEQTAFPGHARLAERSSAVHAARALQNSLFMRKRNVKFHPVLRTLFRRTAGADFPVVFHKSSRFTHNYRTSL